MGLAQNGERVVRSLVYTTTGYLCLVSDTKEKTLVRSMEQLMELLGVRLTDLARTRDDGGYSFLAQFVLQLGLHIFVFLSASTPSSSSK